MRRDEKVEELAIVVDGRGDVAGGDAVRAALERGGDLVRGEVLRDDLSLIALAHDGVVKA